MKYIILVQLIILVYLLIAHILDIKELRNYKRMIEAYEFQEKLKDKIITNDYKIIENKDKDIAYYEDKINTLYNELNSTKNKTAELSQYYRIKNNELTIEYDRELNKKECIIEDIQKGISRYKKSLDSRLNRIVKLEDTIENKKRIEILKKGE